MKRFDGKLVLATGTASGLGRAAARQLAQEGARLVLVDWDATVLEDVARETGAIAVQGDVSDEATVARAFAAAEAIGPVDILINNAGIDPLPATTVPGTTVAEFDRVMAVNVRGPFLFCRMAIERWLAAKRGGVIVNTASIAGLMACPAEAAYATSKAAVVNLTRCIALDHAKDGIRANALCPGVLEGVMADRRAEMSHDQLAARHASEAGAPMGRAGGYEEVAKALLFLASDDASYCNGTPLVVDGGMIAGYSGHGTTLWAIESPKGRNE